MWLRILRWADYPGWPRWAQGVITSVLIRRRQGRPHRHREERVIWQDERLKWCGHQPRSASARSARAKAGRRETRYPLEPLEEVRPSQHFDSSPEIVVLAFGLQSWEGIVLDHQVCCNLLQQEADFYKVIYNWLLHSVFLPSLLERKVVSQTLSTVVKSCSFRARFFNLSIVDILGQITVVSCSLHCCVFCPILDPLDMPVVSSLQLWQKNQTLQTLPNITWGTKSLPVENH